MNNLFVFLILWLGCLNTIAQVSQNKIDVSNKFLILLTSEQFEEATAFFDEIVLKQLPPEKLKQVWNTVNTQVVKFKKHTETHTEQIPNYDMVFLTCEFENTHLDIKLVFASDGDKIKGFFFVPPKPQEDKKLPPYAEPDTYIEKEIEILSGKKSVKFVSYPKLNHLFMEGEGKSSPAEYAKPNHIPEYVIRDLAKWIFKH